MRKKILFLVLSLFFVLPIAIFITACNGDKDSQPKEDGFSIYFDNTIVNDLNNTLEIKYGEYNDISDFVNKKLMVILNYDNETTKQINYGNGGYSVSGLLSEIKANENGYKINISYKDYNQEIILIVHKANIDFSNVKWNYDGSDPYTYDGEEKTVELVNLPDCVEVIYENNKATNAGSYNAIANLAYDEENYNINNYDHICFSKSWNIEKAVINMELVGWNYKQSQPYTYNGKKQIVELLNLPRNVKAIYENNEAADVGEYITNVKLIYDTENYQLDNFNFSETINWKINKQEVERPDVKNINLYYTGQEQTKIIFDDSKENVLFIIEGDRIGINAGNYSVTFKLIDKNNFEWDNETFNDITINWKIEQVENTISGELALNSIIYGETLSEPRGVSALYGEIIYKYYNDQYEEISKPTNVGTYYVKGFSTGNNNWISKETDHKQFYISKKYLEFPKLLKNSFIYTGATLIPGLVDEIDESIIEMTGDLSGIEIGKYAITFTLKDKTNYGWKDIYETQQYVDDVILNWSIISSPISLEVNFEPISEEEIETIDNLMIEDLWSLEVKDGFSSEVLVTYKDTETNQYVQDKTNKSLFYIDYNYYTYTINIYSSEILFYTKTINVDHNVIEKVFIGDEEKSFDEFIKNPIVDYGEKISFIFTEHYKNFFSYNLNNFVIVTDTIFKVYYMGETYLSVNIILNKNIQV